MDLKDRQKLIDDTRQQVRRDGRLYPGDPGYRKLPGDEVEGTLLMEQAAAEQEMRRGSPE